MSDAHEPREPLVPTSPASESDAGALLELPAYVNRASLNDTGHVAIDAPCATCGYNLRGLPAGGRCPECGGPVVAGLRGELLRYREPAWVAGVAQGAELLGMSLLTLGVAGVVVSLAHLKCFDAPTRGSLAHALSVLGVLCAVMCVISTPILYAFGHFLFTARDPSLRRGAEPWWPRRTARLLWFAVPGYILAVCAGIEEVRPSTAAAAGWSAAVLLGALFIAAVAVAHDLARRVPDRKLAAQFKVVGILTCIGMGLVGLTLMLDIPRRSGVDVPVIAVLSSVCVFLGMSRFARLATHLRDPDNAAGLRDAGLVGKHAANPGGGADVESGAGDGHA